MDVHNAESGHHRDNRDMVIGFAICSIHACAGDRAAKDFSSQNAVSTRTLT
jgi:hypothetical protein